MMSKHIQFLLVCVMIGVTAAPAYAAYKRVVSLGPSVTEIIYDLDKEDALVGITDFCDYPPETSEKTSVGGWLNPNLEKIVSLSPDMVITSKNGGQLVIARKLQEFGIGFSFAQFYSFADVKQSFRKIGALLGVADKAEERVRIFEQVIAAYKEQTASLPQKKVLFVRWHNPLTVAGAGSLEDEILQVLGCKNIIESEIRYPVYTMEAVIAAEPDIIIDLGSYDTPTEQEKQAIAEFWRPWGLLPAVKNNQIFTIRTDVHSVPGPRTSIFIDEVAAIAHPDVFESKWGLSEKINIS